MNRSSAWLKRAGWTFVQAFIATLLIQAPGAFQAANLNEAKALIVATITAALAAGLSALKNLVITPPEVQLADDDAPPK